MGQTLRILKVFLSSPSGLGPERKAVRDVVAQLNADLGDTFRLHFSVVASDTHAVPGVSSDPQAVINDQGLDRADVYLGLMWHRYGTPTGRAGSGTEEEFDRALKRNPRPEILFYFKTDTVPPFEIDVDQLKRVSDFRSGMAAHGVLYSEFQNLNEFQTHLRTHLTSIMQRFGTKSSSDSVSSEAEFPEKSPYAADLGLLDYLDGSQTHMYDFQESTSRLMEGLNRLRTDFREMKRDLTAEPVDYGSAMGRARARTIYNQAADNLLRHTDEVNAEVLVFRQSIRGGVDAMTRALAVGTEDRVVGAARQIPLARALYRLLYDSLAGHNETLSQLHAAVRDMPRMTVTLNRAQQATVACVSGLGEAFEEARRVLKEAIEEFDRIPPA